MGDNMQVLFIEPRFKQRIHDFQAQVWKCGLFILQHFLDNPDKCLNFVS